MNGLEWFGFWIFLAVLVVCDTYLFTKGYNTLFWEAATEQEKELHDNAGKKSAKDAS